MRLIHLMHFRAKQGYEIDIRCLHPPTKYDQKYADPISIRRLQNTYHYLCLDFYVRDKTPHLEILLTEWRQESQQKFLDWCDQKEAEAMEEKAKSSPKAMFFNKKSKKSTGFKSTMREILQAFLL